MKNKKLLLVIGLIVIIGLLLARFLINENSEKKNIGNTNPDSKSINNDGTLENDYTIIESSNEFCSKDKDCELSPLFMSGYAFRSDCPYQSKCIQNICTVICPDFGWGKIKNAIYDCEVKNIFQNHKNKVTAILKDGSEIEAIEPNIDDVFYVVKEAESKCGEIMMATE